MISLEMFLLIIGCAIVTWIPRVLPFAFMKKVKLPTLMLRWLAYIPICILSALVISNLFVKKNGYVLINWPIFIAAIPTLIVALWTKSLSLTVIVGVVAMAIIQYFFL